MIYGDLKKKTLGGFLALVVYTHCQHTFQFKHVKVNLASDDPFKTSNKLLIFEQ